MGCAVSNPSVIECIKKGKVALLGVGAFSGILNLLALTGSLYMLQIYDRVIPSQSVPTLVGLTVILILLYTGFGALDFARARILSRVGLGIDRQLRDRAFEAALLLPLRTRGGTEAAHPVRDLDQVRSFFSGPGLSALFDLPWLPVYLTLVFLLHPSLGAFATTGAVLIIALTALTEFKTTKLIEASVSKAALRGNFLDGAQLNAEVIRSMGLERRLSARWDVLTADTLASQLSISDVAGGFAALSKALRLLLQSGVLGYGAYLTIEGELSAGSLIAASIVTSRALAPIEVAIANWKAFVSMRQSAKRFGQVLSWLPARDDQLSLPRPVKSLEVEDLAVAAPGQSVAALRGVSFKLEAGDGLGVIGPSGSGKSTLARALVGVWTPLPRGGSVRLDGAALDQWRPDELGRDIGYLPQDVQLFDGTIADNISRFDPQATSTPIIRAAKSAGVHDMIVSLPAGYNTKLGNRGMTLSAGQRQRLGLARALYGEPFLVVLDEPNSNLDATGEINLIDAIRSVRERGGIAIVAAHRPSILTSLNKVLALANGQMQVVGPRDQIFRRALQAVATAVSPTTANNEHAPSPAVAVNI